MKVALCLFPLRIFFRKKGGSRVNEYRGKHAPSTPWAVSSTASPRYRSRHARPNMRRRRMRIVLIILVALIVIIPLLDPLFIRTDRVSLTAEDLPADIGHLHVVYLSDIHFGFFFPVFRVNSLVDQINALKPDLVLFGGGYGTDNASAIRFFNILPSIHARYAVYGVIGDTDRGDSDVDLTLLREAMRSAGVIPLVNEVAQVRVGNTSIYVAGPDDYKTGKPAVQTMASGVSISDYVIFLGHNPTLISDAQSATDSSGRLGWFDLTLFGHTHGGQIPLLSSLLGIGTDVEERYRSGWMQENRVDILVSNGVGTSVIPARAFCPAQIHYIDISVP